MSANASQVPLAAILSLTGNYSQVGVMQERALQMAISLVNQQGGIDGKRVTLDIFDDHSDVGNAYYLARTLVRQNHVKAIIGGTTSASCAAIRVQTGPKRMVQYCLSSAASSGGTFFSSFPAATDLFGRVPATFFARHNLHRVAVMTAQGEAGTVYEKAINHELSKEASQVVANDTITDQMSAQAAVRQALAEHADVVYIGADAVKTALILQALRERRARTTVWIAGGVSAAATRSMFAAVLPSGPVYSSGDAIDVAEQLPSTNVQRAVLVAYVHAFQARYSVRPDVNATIAADAMEFLVAALRSDRGIGGVSLAHAIESIPPAIGLYSFYHFSSRQHAGADVPGIVSQLHGDDALTYIETI